MTTQKTIHLNIDQTYNTPQIPLTDKTQEKHGVKVLSNSIDKIKCQWKILIISIEGRLTIVENQLRETMNDSQPNPPASLSNRTDDTT